MTAYNVHLCNLSVKPISLPDARSIVCRKHYMKTWPAGARIAIGIFDEAKVVGVVVFGYSTATRQKVKKLAQELDKSQFIEMQRFWISDIYGGNTESYCLSRTMRLFKKETQLRLIVTHAGGCKNDCGIVYQASGWLYFGRTKCLDFYHTVSGEYKNLVAPMRFGKVQTRGKSKQEIGSELFGPGHIVNSWRYLYCYPIEKGLRRRLTKLQHDFPKESDRFRRDQIWIDCTTGSDAGGVT